jgi:hypothetical protein
MGAQENLEHNNLGAYSPLFARVYVLLGTIAITKE